MYSYYKGIVADIYTHHHRHILVLEINNIGYEIQIPYRFRQQLQANLHNLVTVYIHLQIRDEQPFLYGFATMAERDLFRQLIGVSGVGAQLAISLLDTLELENLISAIATGNIRLLTKTPGIGNKIAERIILELKGKLSLPPTSSAASDSPPPPHHIVEEVEKTLSALGYTPSEIQQAISVITKDSLLLKNPRLEEWIKTAIQFLSLNAN
ncbi:MAG: Holliday junction branch migration protein RuvA [Geminocystis sp.]|nr:Holliday junction branch migration protein RuvA [Geminocystis sp.]HIK36479.1 Holliday junction branch migration protein RuvA [Geminocystis sp. M7585_C2015_104]